MVKRLAEVYPVRVTLQYTVGLRTVALLLLQRATIFGDALMKTMLSEVRGIDCMLFPAGLADIHERLYLFDGRMV